MDVCAAHAMLRLMERSDATREGTRDGAGATDPAVGDRAVGSRAAAPPLFAARFHPLLAKASFRYGLALTVVVCLLPTVRTGFVWDDMFHRLAVQGAVGIRRAPFDLFDFLPRDAAERRALLEHGIGAWWQGPQMHVAYFRPLASLTHYLDYAFWPGAPWLMHLESVAWYAAAVVACGAFYRRFIETRWAIGLATFLFAFDHVHAGPVAWIANRSAIMALLFGILCVAAHDRWRREGRREWAPIAWVLFALAVLSAESGLAIGGYLVAYAVCLERGSPARRALALVPYGVLAATWRVVYAALGYGVAGCGINSDPLREPLSFAARALQSIPLLVASDIVAMPADALVAAPWLLRLGAVVAVALVGLFVWACWPIVRGDRASRFFALGALLATLPFGGLLPTSRYLFWTGLGVMGLLAQVAGASALAQASRPARSFCLALLSMHFFLSPLLFPIAALGPSIWRSQMARVVATFPSNAAVARRTVVMLNAPNDLVAIFVPITSVASGGVAPAHTYLLHAGLEDLRLARTGPRSLELTAPKGWMPGPLDRTLRDVPFEAGDHVVLEGMGASVRAVTDDGRAQAVRFEFPVDLEDRSLAFLAWGRHGLEPFALPRVGATATLQAPPVLVR
jgi:hypothetical protein